MIRAILDSLETRGLMTTLSLAICRTYDYYFDVKYNIKTVRKHTLDELTINSVGKEGGTRYQPTMVLPMRRLFRKRSALNPRESVFVDFGCGKGRTLVVAAELGFAGVRGVEFAAELCESAEKNYRLYQKKSGNRVDFRIVMEDVSDYAVKEDENVFLCITRSLKRS